MNEQKNEEALKESFMSIYSLIKRMEKQFAKIERQVLQERPRFDKKKITPPQYFVLRYLWYSDEVPIKNLATAARCSRSTMTGIIDTMENSGLIERISNPSDGRSILIKLTDLGRDLRRYNPPLDEYLLEHCTSLSREELQMLDLLLKKMLKSLED